MNKIGLDLAYRTVGIAIINKEKLIYTSYDLSKERLPTPTLIYHMVDKVWETIERYITTPHSLVIEDIFKGKWDNLKNIARVQGGVISRYIQATGLCPELILATDARKRVNIPIIAPKVAIQLWALDLFKIDTRRDIDPVYRKRIEESIKEYYKLYSSKNKSDKKRIKLLEKQFDTDTKRIHEITGLDNHSADAMVLALCANT